MQLRRIQLTENRNRLSGDCIAKGLLSGRLVVQRFDTNNNSALRGPLSRSLRLIRGLRIPTAPERDLFVPSLQFRTEREDAPQLPVKVAMNRKTFPFFP